LGALQDQVALKIRQRPSGRAPFSSRRSSASGAIRSQRYGFFYGPGTWYTREGDIGDQVRQQQVPIIGEGQGVFSFVQIDDAAAATAAALECPPGAYNVDGKPVASARVAGGVRACCGSTCAASRQRKRSASDVGS
jgi:nucleoside-diphosphate-sugar epimerase